MGLQPFQMKTQMLCMYAILEVPTRPFRDTKHKKNQMPSISVPVKQVSDPNSLK